MYFSDEALRDISFVLIASLVFPVGSAIAQQTTAPSPSPSPSSVPKLDCQGCHAPGKTALPPAATSFTPTLTPPTISAFTPVVFKCGMKAATCIDCHTTNKDLTKILPASDPRSTISRTNIAETCGAVMATSR